MGLKMNIIFDIPYLQDVDNLYDALKKGIPPKLIAKKVVDLIKLLTKKNLFLIKN